MLSKQLTEGNWGSKQVNEWLEVTGPADSGMLPYHKTFSYISICRMASLEKQGGAPLV